MLSFDDGVHLLGSALYLDPRRRKERAVVTHAHSDHVARHRRWVASPATASLCARRWRADDLEVHDFHRPWQEDGAVLTLLPAGHILGSSMVLVEAQGLRVLYTGDFKLRPSATAEPCAAVPADILVMECTFGHPHYRFPSREQVVNQLSDFIDETFAREATPVLLAYSLGKAQEVARLIGDRGYSVVLHSTAYEMLKVYQEMGVHFGSCRRYAMEPLREQVLIVPPHVASSALVRGLTRRRVAFLSGWALHPGWRSRSRCDAAFALSDHADFDELLELVDHVRPRKIYTLHGPERFAALLRSRGFDAEPAARAAQLQLL